METFLYQEMTINYMLVGPVTHEPPLIILNGIMMRVESWATLAQGISKHRQVILMDFIDQGSSHKKEQGGYDHQLQVAVVLALMTHLGHKVYDLFGISYGGQVALQVAIKAPMLIRRLAVFNAAAYTTPWLKDIGRSWIKTAETYDSEAFYLVTIPYIYSSRFYSQEIDWMEKRKVILEPVFNKAFLDALVRLIKSSENYDLRGQLNQITCPSLVVGSSLDYLTPPNETRALADAIKGSIYMEIENCGHASMYEKPNTFLMLLEGFLSMDTGIR